MGSGCSKTSQTPTGNEKKKKKGEDEFLLKKCEEHTGGINAVCISTDFKTVVTVSEDSTGRLWDIKSGECVGILEGHSQYIRCVCVNEHYVFTGSADKTARKWSLETGLCLKPIFSGHNSVINSVICTGDYLFTSSYDRTVRCWQIDTGECVRTFRGHKMSVIPILLVPSEANRGTFIDIDNSDDILVSGSVDGTAKAWTLGNMSLSDRPVTFGGSKGHTGAVLCLAVDQKGRKLFTGSTDTFIKSWNIDSGELLNTFTGHLGPVLSLQLVNKLLYSSSSDKTARCWVAAMGDCTREYKGHKHIVSRVLIHSGLVFTASGDGTVRVYDKSGTNKRVYRGHQNGVNDVLFHKGKVYTISQDETLRIWDGTKLKEDEEYDEENN